MEFLTNEKLTIVGAAGMIGSNMAQTAIMMHLPVRSVWTGTGRCSRRDASLWFRRTEPYVYFRHQRSVDRSQIHCIFRGCRPQSRQSLCRYTGGALFSRCLSLRGCPAWPGHHRQLPPGRYGVHLLLLSRADPLVTNAMYRPRTVCGA